MAPRALAMAWVIAQLRRFRVARRDNRTLMREDYGALRFGFSFRASAKYFSASAI